MHTIISPLKIVQNEKKGKYFILNINRYRNAHYHTLNTMKVRYKNLIQDQLDRLPKMDRITLEFVLYPATAMKTDISNVCAIHDKFFADALVDSKIIEDDNYEFINLVVYRFGNIDRENPRVEIHIRNLV